MEEELTYDETSNVAPDGYKHFCDVYECSISDDATNVLYDNYGMKHIPKNTSCQKGRLALCIWCLKPTYFLRAYLYPTKTTIQNEIYDQDTLPRVGPR